MSKIPNWSRDKEAEEAGKYTYRWVHDQSDEIENPEIDEVGISILSFDNGKVMVNAHGLFPRDVASVTTGGAHPQEYDSVEEAREEVVQYLREHPMYIRNKSKADLREKLDEEYGTTKDWQDIAYFLKDIVDGRIPWKGEQTEEDDYYYHIYQGSNQFIIWNNNTGEKVYDSEERMSDKAKAVDLAHKIVGNEQYIDYEPLREEFQRKTFDDMLEDTLGV